MQQPAMQLTRFLHQINQIYPSVQAHSHRQAGQKFPHLARSLSQRAETRISVPTPPKTTLQSYFISK